jgi:hypothetical protein
MSKFALGDSPLFATRPKQVPPSEDALPIQEPEKAIQVGTKEPAIHDARIPGNHDTMPPQYDPVLIAQIRKKVKEFGKEAATFRFTLDEKRALREIIYKFSTREIHTSENEVTRISINFIIEDFKRNGKDSLLQGVIDALNG